MSEFQLYFVLGKDHILDYANGYDHILFVVALCAIYVVRDWRHLLILITAFTIGHSVTLALATLNLISMNTAVVELLIPITILITAASNLFTKESGITHRPVQVNYLFAVFFGLIHGMGFSSYLKALLGKGHEILTPLLAFNIGLEFGQIIIVGFFLAVSFIAIDWLGVARRDWKMVLSSGIAGMALILIKDRLTELF
jgi:hypothetical protein